MSAWTLIAAGFGLTVAGFLLPFLLVLRVIESGFALIFAAYLSSVLGLLGTVYGLCLRRF